MGTELFHAYGRMDEHDKACSRFSQLRKAPKKWIARWMKSTFHREYVKAKSKSKAKATVCFTGEDKQSRQECAGVGKDLVEFQPTHRLNLLKSTGYFTYHQV
jgi:hypothetical protein